MNPDFEIGRFLTEKTGVHAGAQDPGRARVPQGRGASRRRSRCSRSWCPTRGKAGSGSWVSSAATSSRSPASSTGSNGSRPPRPHLLELSETGAARRRLRGRRLGAALGGRARARAPARCTWPSPATRRPGLRPRAADTGGARPRWPRRLQEQSRQVLAALAEQARPPRRPIQRAWPSACSTRAPARRRAIGRLAGRRSRLVKIRCPRRLPPRPGPLAGERLHHPRLRGRARPIAGRAAGQAVAAQGRRRDAPVVRLRRLQRAADLHAAASSRRSSGSSPGPGSGGPGPRPHSSGSIARSPPPASLPPTATRPRRLLDFFMLEKTVFELQYELNYRPDWVADPLARDPPD